MLPSEILARLQKIKDFAEWSDADLAYLSKRIGDVDYRAGSLIFSANSTADDAYIVHSGRVKQTAYTPAGDPWQFRTLTPDEIFAQQALFRGRSYACTAEAEVDTSLLVIPAADLGWALNRHPDLWKLLLSTNITARLRAIPLLRSLDDSDIARLAASTKPQEFDPNKSICQTNDAEGNLWIIDWGQVEVTDQGQIDTLTGNPRIGSAGPRSIRNQGIAGGPLLTAGNWFVGGLVDVPNLFTVTATAKTKVRLLRIPGDVLKSLWQPNQFLDLRGQMKRRDDFQALLEAGLGSDDIFDGLEAEHWQELAGVAKWEHIPGGIDVTRQGDRDPKLFLMIAGHAIVRATDDEGRERPRHYMMPGDFFGISEFTMGDRRDATVRAVKENLDGADWLILHREDVLYLMKANPALWRNTVLRGELIVKPRKKSFPWLEEGEEVEYFGRRHWIVLVDSMSIPFFIGFVAALALSLTHSGVEYIGSYTLGMIVLVLLLLPLPLYDYLNDYYVITNRRVAVKNQRLIFSEIRQEAPIERIQDITLKTDLWAKALSYGDLTISTAATAGTFSFSKVPNPEHVQGIIQAQQRRARAGRQAVQREVLRQQLVKRLQLRIEPTRRDRALPDGIKPPSRGLTAWLEARRASFRKIGKSIGAFFQYLNTAGLILLFFGRLLSPNARKRLEAERKKPRQKKKKQTQVDQKVYRRHFIFLIREAWLALLVFLLALTIFVDVETSIIFHWTSYSWLSPRLLTILRFLALGMWIVTGIILYFQIEDYLNDKYILTKTHIIDVEAKPFGFQRQQRQAEWDRVQNATYTKPNIWATFFNFGTVIIETAAEEGKFDFVNVPRPDKVQKEIFRRLEAHRLAKEAKEAIQRQAAFSESLQIYDEVMQNVDWHNRP